MNKIAVSVIVLVFFCLSCFANGKSDVRFYENLIPDSRQYVMTVNSYDWGPAIDSAIVNVGYPIVSFAIDKNEFAVDVIGAQATKKLSIVTGRLEVTEAYLSDEYGKKLVEDSSDRTVKSPYVVLKFRISPEIEACKPFVSFPASVLKNVIKELRIKNDILDINITDSPGINSSVASFQESSFHWESEPYYEDDDDEEEIKDIIDMNYTYWEPEDLAYNDKVPLVIWLHGVSEGGVNPYIPLLSCKVSNLTNNNIQSYFGEKGACVLVPQATTSWLESTSKDIFGNRFWVVVDMKNTIKKLTGRVSKLITENFSVKSKNNSSIPSASVSYYTEALKGLIDDYIATRHYIDTNRIYIMGGSAGGYMVLNMCIQYPNLFAAAVPCSEAYPDAKITGFQLDILSKQHIWFIHAKNDKIVSPDKYDKKTIRRLSILLAEDIKYSLFDNVMSDDGHEYSGHDTWIYLFADKCKDENGVSLFEWLASKSLP